MKKKIFVFFFILLLFISILPSTSAWFMRDHTRFTLTGFDEVNSPITEKCRPYMNIVLDGNGGNDLGVLHYKDNEVTSYITTHTKLGMETCDEEAGTDDELWCMCVGSKLHDVQDYYAHGENGLVTKYLEKFLGNNYIWHMVVEKNFEKQNDIFYAQTSPELTSRVDAYDKIVLNNLFPELGGDQKFMDLINDVAGIDMSNDARIFRTAYVGDSSFFNTVYKDKTTIPYVFIIIPIGLIILGLLIMGLMFWFGRTNWKWLAIIFGAILLIMGLLILYTFMTGTTWKVINLIITIPPMFGYMQVSEPDVQYYNGIVQEATNEYLRTGQFNILDASGLSYTRVNENGIEEKVVGSLTQASKGSDYVIALVVLLLFVALLNIFFKSLIEKSRRTHSYRALNKTLNVSLLVLSLMFVGLLVYFVVRAFVF